MLERVGILIAMATVLGCAPDARFEALATSPKALELLQMLKGSSNPWIREYAALGLCPSKD